jgi:uncharacterized membrane protein
VFIFLAGSSAWIAGTRRTPAGLSRFLLTRGLWLILLELTVISFAWHFSFDWPQGARAQVIWAIGASMVVLAGLIHLPRPAIVGFGLVLVLGHNLLDGITPESLGAMAPLWNVLHARGALGVVPVFISYPLVPWIGVMALGYAAGPAIFSRDLGVSRRLAWAGAALVLGFVALRWLAATAIPIPAWTTGARRCSRCRFSNVTKYPPSLLYVLVTWGRPSSRWRPSAGPLARWPGALSPSGGFRSSSMWPICTWCTRSPWQWGWRRVSEALQVMYTYRPEGFGFGLPVIYLVWLAVVAVLYPLCRRYAELKARTRAWWLSYL